jgi:asparagine synthase (glutamine-hydrolysing)
VLEEASRIVWHQDEPYGSTSIHAQWHVFATTQAQGLKVMLDGQGADEILAGYHGAYDTRYAELIRNRKILAAIIFAARRSQWFGKPFAYQMAVGALQLAGISPTSLRASLSTAAGMLGRSTLMGVGSEPWLRLEGFGLTTPINVWTHAMAEAGLPEADGLGTLCFCIGKIETAWHMVLKLGYLSSTTRWLNSPLVSGGSIS